MIRSQAQLVNPQRPLEERLGLGIIAGQLDDRGQVADRVAGREVIWTEGALENRDRAFQVELRRQEIEQARRLQIAGRILLVKPAEETLRRSLGLLGIAIRQQFSDLKLRVGFDVLGPAEQGYYAETRQSAQAHSPILPKG